MTYNEAKKKIIIRWLVGAPTLISSSVSSIISALKMFYFGLDSADKLSGIISQPVRRIVYQIFENTHFFDIFWVYSPVPTPRELFSNDNLLFFVVYLCVFVGMALIGSARSLSARLDEIDKEIENELIRDSVRGNIPRQRQEIQDQLSVQKSGFVNQLHTLYLAPIIVGLAVALLAKLSGLV